jgi:hypothetical protein
MCGMNQPQLPIPNPADWMTRAAAAFALGVDPATVSRMVADGILTARRPVGGPAENPPLILWRAEVEELSAARARAMRRARA